MLGVEDKECVKKDTISCVPAVVVLVVSDLVTGPDFLLLEGGSVVVVVFCARGCESGKWEGGEETVEVLGESKGFCEVGRG